MIPQAFARAALLIGLIVSVGLLSYQWGPEPGSVPYKVESALNLLIICGAAYCYQRTHRRNLWRIVLGTSAVIAAIAIMLGQMQLYLAAIAGPKDDTVMYVFLATIHAGTAALCVSFAGLPVLGLLIHAGNRYRQQCYITLADIFRIVAVLCGAITIVKALCRGNNAVSETIYVVISCSLIVCWSLVASKSMSKAGLSAALPRAVMQFFVVPAAFVLPFFVLTWLFAAKLLFAGLGVLIYVASIAVARLVAHSVLVRREMELSVVVGSE